MSNITVIGIDLAKDIFQLHGIDEKGKCVLRKRLTGDSMIKLLSNLSPCLIGIEACGGSHAWARCFIQMGHTVKMIAPQYVKPFVKTNKSDANDAAAIATAVMRPDMRFVPIKSIEQQDMQLVHTVRQLAIKHRTALGNEIRGILLEYKIIIPQGICQLRAKLAEILTDEPNRLTNKAREILLLLQQQFYMIDEQIDKYDREITRTAGTDERCQRLMKIEGIGPVIATAMVAAVGNAKEFRNGRGLSAWLGLVPKQHSSGHKIRLSGISKRGNTYLRSLLIQGARSVMRCCDNKKDSRSIWIKSKKELCENKAAVALANKNARIIWALLTKETTYQVAMAP
jgi:transposase